MLKINTTINAGVEIECGDKLIMIDALTSEKVFNFSALTDKMTEKIWHKHQQIQPDIVFFTHNHPDHFSLRLAREAKERWPLSIHISSVDIGTEQILLTKDFETYTFDNLKMNFIQTSHLPINLPYCPHYSCLMEIDGLNILAAGDCAVADPSLINYLNDVHLDLAILNFTWWTFPRGRKALEEIIRPEKLLLVHLPEPENDTDQIRKYLFDTLASCSSLIEIQVADHPFKTISFNL